MSLRVQIAVTGMIAERRNEVEALCADLQRVLTAHGFESVEFAESRADTSYRPFLSDDPFGPPTRSHRLEASCYKSIFSYRSVP
jgi:hypothetical protein